MMWLIEDHELPTAQMPFAQAALNTAGIPEEFIHRAVQQSDDFHRTLMQWYAWLLQITQYIGSAEHAVRHYNRVPETHQGA